MEAAQEERAAVAADFDAIEQIEVERMKREQAQDDDEDEEKGQSQINMKVEQPWHVMLKNEQESGKDNKRRKSEDGEEEDEGDGNQGKKNSVVSFEGECAAVIGFCFCFLLSVRVLVGSPVYRY